MPLQRAIRAIVIVVIIQAFFLAVGTYDRIPDIDILMHFLGGFVIAMLAIAIHHRMTDKHHMQGHPDWYHITFVLGFVMLIGVAWEFHEYVLDNTAVLWWGWPKNQLDLADTMLDFAMDAVGGLIAFSMFKKGL